MSRQAAAWGRRVLGVLLMLSGVLQLFGWPGDLPTWLDWLWQNSPPIPDAGTATNLPMIFINLAMIFIGLLLLVGTRRFSWCCRRLISAVTAALAQHTSVDRGLRVSAEREEWSLFQGEWLFLALKIRIENPTDSPIQLASYQWESEWGTARLSMEVLRLREAIQADRGPLIGRIDARDMTSCWAVNVFRRPLEGGTPSYILVIKDALGNEYRLEQPSGTLQTSLIRRAS